MADDQSIVVAGPIYRLVVQIVAGVTGLTLLYVLFVPLFLPDAAPVLVAQQIFWSGFSALLGLLGGKVTA